MYYYKARFYSPVLGRFLQTDPIGYKDDQNLYAYVGSNSINRTDPSGLSGVTTGGQTSAVKPQSSLQPTSLGPWMNDAPLAMEPGLEAVYPEGYLLGGGVGGIVKAEARIATEISYLVRTTKGSATQLSVGSTQAQAIESLLANGFSKTISKDGTVTVMSNGEKIYKFYPASTGGGVAGAASGVPSASVSIGDDIIAKLRFLGN